MSISAIQSQNQAASIEELLGSSVKKSAQEQNGSGAVVYSWGEDSVTISAEALSKAANLQQDFSGSGEEGASEGGASSGAGASGGADGTSSVEEQIAVLEQQIAAIQASDMPSGEKSSMIGALQAQISALRAQVG